MKICLTWKIIVCGLLCVFPVDIKGQACQCTYRNGGECSSCSVGCYLTSGGRCYQCSRECYSCSQSFYCDVCKPGYYGQKCDNDCITCRDGLCANNTCTDGCTDGYYYYDSGGYCLPCLNKCVTCNSYSDCTSCTTGRNGSYCQNCKDGYYHNNDRQCIPCNTNCLLGKCDVNGGQCKDGCQDGWSGWRCNDACVPTCYSCQRYSKSTCNSCPFGHYGTSCESKCSSNCATTDGVRQCSETNGDCNYGCVDGWTGSKCTEKCNVNCLTCDAQDKAICHTCRPKFYGQSCENECSSKCLKTADRRQCRKSDGQCSEMCVEGWTVSTCTEQCIAKCTSCDRQNGIACTSCKPGYYGPSCYIDCSEYCGNMSDANRQCQPDDGICLDDCVLGYKGEQCDVPCIAGCDSGCDQDTGVCQPCEPTYFGPSCQHLCNATCYDPGNGSNVCHQLSGECLFDCSQVLCSPDGQTSVNQGNSFVIGGAVGSAIIIMLIISAVVVFIFIKRRRRNKADPERSVTYENYPIDIVPCNLGVTCNDSATESTVHCTTLNPSLGPIRNGEAYYTTLIPSLGPVYEELDKNDDIDYGDIKDYEVPTTSKYCNT